MIALPPALLAEIERAAEGAYPAEACGLIVGRGAPGGALVATRLVPSRNLAADASRRFEVDPQVRFDLERALRGGPERLIGHYHSHPEGPARPSATDREHAFEPGLVWLVTALDRGRAGETRAYVFDAGSGAFREVPLSAAAEIPGERRMLKLRKGYKKLLAEANRKIETIPAAECLKLAGDPGVVFVDLRDVRELEREGMIEGAFHAPRGMLEFWVDPESPYHREVFASGRKFVFYCASGWRSALAARAVQEMGLKPVCHMGGGFTAWKEAGGKVVPRPERKPG
ncbi:MAG: Mov34/MPN/PAD-1 family protein [Proteobacteria bacterium]|nr:Mov34/MPN/PAD-1 family protein [Pseudomonadota bacterium]